MPLISKCLFEEFIDFPKTNEISMYVFCISLKILKHYLKVSKCMKIGKCNHYFIVSFTNNLEVNLNFYKLTWKYDGKIVPWLRNLDKCIMELRIAQQPPQEQRAPGQQDSTLTWLQLLTHLKKECVTQKRDSPNTEIQGGRIAVLNIM